MRIVHIASEFAPIAKAGGLGEVLVGLSREQSRSGNLVEIIIPKYDFIDSRRLNNLNIECADFKCLGSSNLAWKAQVEECSLHLIDARHPAGYFHRGRIYGCFDDIARFTYFSRAALEYLRVRGEPIDVLHLHDWHVSLCAPMVKDLFKDLVVKSIVLTIHNVEYQGKCASYDLDLVGMQGAQYLTQDRLQDDDPEFPETINLLKGGIVYSDAVVTVSPTYAKEILSSKYGFGLEKTLQREKIKLTGILNGIDMKIWDPATDQNLSAQYGVETALKAKQINRKQFDLIKDKGPWIGAVTRLASQKGPELIEEAIRKTLELGGTFVLLGSASDAQIQGRFDELKQKYRDNAHVMLNFNYDERLAHLIYGSLDFLIVPSLFEPCGLTQMIAMRYGAIPIVRATGGLKDTVFDFDDFRRPSEKRNGFVFLDYTKESMNGAIVRAFDLFRKDPASFKALVRKGMCGNYDWKKSAQAYQRLYHNLQKKKMISKGFLNIGPVGVDVVAD